MEALPSEKVKIPIQFLKGVGPKRAKALELLNIQTVEDLLYYFPRRHVDRTITHTIDSLTLDHEVNVIGRIKSIRYVKRFKKSYVIANFADHTGSMTLMWFNAAEYIGQSLKENDLLAIHGKVTSYQNKFQIVHPEYDKLNANEITVNTGLIIPIYPLTEDLKKVGLDSRNLRKIIANCIKDIEQIDDFLTQEYRDSLGLCSLDFALRNIHFTKNLDHLNSAITRLKFDEHFFIQLLFATRKKQIQNSTCLPLEKKLTILNKITNSLTFELTSAQRNSINEIIEDLCTSHPMNRMIQGDVGSGKTIVACLISALVVENDYQVAIMAPTDLLANQIFRNFEKYFSSLKINCSIILGSQKGQTKKEILKKIASGESSIIVGTHALFQKNVTFKNLGLTIIDEQHRFGVNQREKLIKKSKIPNLLSMTATPIPRTLAITYNGDMDISLIDELPKNRPDIFTTKIQTTDLPVTYDFIKGKIKKGEQAIIVYPLIEETEKSDLKAATESYEKLKKQFFSNYNVGLLHGKINNEDKNQTMLDFLDGKIDILVSTTVVEVGIDNPNATIMLINNAERFGLSQLHQLRGRVGRGEKESHCILCSDSFSDKSNNRLDILTKTRNGFLIADEDLKIRGPGEFFGEKQSGFIKYRIADLVTDGPIIREARKFAFQIIDNDSKLLSPDNNLIKKKFEKDYLNLFLKITVN
jgi:ATP-dependent DNA helicase RecG